MDELYTNRPFADTRTPTPIAHPPPQKSPARWLPRGSDRDPIVIGIMQANCGGSDLIMGLLDHIGVKPLGIEGDLSAKCQQSMIVQYFPRAYHPVQSYPAALPGRSSGRVLD